MLHQITSLEDLKSIPEAQRPQCQLAYVAWAKHRKAIEDIGKEGIGFLANAVARDLEGMGEFFVWDDVTGAAA